MSKRTLVDLPIDEVTLLEDRARVVRRGELELTRGVHSLRLDHVAPVIVDKTLRAEVSGGHVRDISVDRRLLIRAEEREAPLEELDKLIEEAADRLRWLGRDIAQRRKQLALYDQALSQTLEDITLDAAWESSGKDEWAARLDALEAKEREATDDLRPLTEEQTELTRTLARAKQRRAVVAQPSSKVRAALDLDLEVEVDGPTEVTIEYLVPNACWRPYHRASLIEGAVVVESEGCVWQNTGEDWTDAKLRMSTQRPSLGVSPPRLRTDQLGVQKKAEVLVVEAREAAVDHTGLGAGKRNDELPGIDDGGEVLELAALHRTSVSSDGRPHRVPLFRFEAPTELELFSAPELNEAVLRKTIQENRAGRPLLAGPVDLVQNGGFVGRTSVLYVAPNERFELGWGPDPALRIHREVESLPPEKNLLRSWTSTTTVVVGKLSNLGPDEKHLELVERVPVSELEKVQIEVDAETTTDGQTPDEDGFVRWKVTVGGFSRERVELRYTLKQHSDVVGL